LFYLPVKYWMVNYLMVFMLIKETSIYIGKLLFEKLAMKCTNIYIDVYFYVNVTCLHCLVTLMTGG
jgi:hypothetical protein